MDSFAFTAQTATDPYDGVPLGVEAIVPLHYTETKGSSDEDRSAAGTIAAHRAWRG
jgi:hypothetical protein